MYMYDGIAWYCLDGSHLKIDRSLAMPIHLAGDELTSHYEMNHSHSFLAAGEFFFLRTNEPRSEQ